jgi:hypothetical protein
MSINLHLYDLDPVTVERVIRDPGQAGPMLFRTDGGGCDVHKAWHAIHYVLTGTADGGSEPHCYLLTGGTELGEEGDDDLDGGYGPPRILRPEQVKAFNTVLQPINTLSALRAKFDHRGMVAAGIYSISDDNEAEDLEFTAHFFKDLRRFIKRAADAGHGVMLTMA